MTNASNTDKGIFKFKRPHPPLPCFIQLCTNIFLKIFPVVSWAGLAAVRPKCQLLLGIYFGLNKGYTC